MSGSSIFESFERRVLLSAVLETDNNQPPADQVALTATATPLMLASNVQLEVADLGVDGVVVLKATVTVPGLPADSTYWPIVWLVDELQNTIAGGRPDQYGNVYFVSPPLGAGTHSLRAVTENLDTVAGSESVPLLVETTDQPDASVAPGAKMEAHSNSFRYPPTVTLFFAEPGKPIPTGTVTLVGDYYHGPQTVTLDAFGRAVLPDFDPRGPGATQVVSWIYSGDDNYAPSSGSEAMSILYPGTTPTTTTTLAVNLVSDGTNRLQLKVTISPGYSWADPAGQVAIYDGAELIAYGFTNEEGVFSIDLPQWPSDLSALRAEYLGNTRVGPSISGAPVSPFVTFVGDVNGDSKADQVLYDRNARTVWFGMDGSVVLMPLQANAAAEGWRLAGVADFDGDGFADLLWTHDQLRKQSIWNLKGRFVQGFSMLNHAPKDNAWIIESVEDFDDDGDADLLWRNTKTGGAYAWLMQGTTVIGGCIPA